MNPFEELNKNRKLVALGAALQAAASYTGKKPQTVYKSVGHVRMRLICKN